ncbi:MAG: 1-acyl-sn-glycerol-3-phosphate acyltransferase [Dysgonomonas sp.]|nr:1-acyl-sn-glycerol-3-phosphate acyltransferase [Dysgonomonas sp.]
MTQFFVSLYNFFQHRKVAFYMLLVFCVGILSYFALQLRFEENITRFFPDTEDDKSLNTVFNHLRVKDKIIIMFSTDSLDENGKDKLIECASQLNDSLQTNNVGKDIANIIFRIDDSLKNEIQNFVYNNLPLLLTDEDYKRMDSLASDEMIASIMQKNYSNLLSPAGGFLKEYVMRDPLGLGGNTLKRLQDFRIDSNFEQEDGYIFANEGSVLLLIITPTHGMGSTGENEKLITSLETYITSLSKDFPSVKAEYFGGPSVSVYNAKQIKSDSILTMIIALSIIIIFISLAFKQKRAIPLILTPVLFGGLFSLCMIYLIKGSISSIAVGAGSVVLGIALSYSIHMIVHQKHVSSVQQLIKEITYPLTVGSFTTVGAFLGLLFTTSDLLRDFGLFASMALIGTTSFCLIFLPHFLKGTADEKKGFLFNFIEKFNAYRFDKNKWLIGGIIILFIICIFTSQWVGFDTDMMRLNYTPDHLKEAEAKMSQLIEGDKKTILVVSTGKEMDEAILHYNKTNKILSQQKEAGSIRDFASADYFLIPQDVRDERLTRWQHYWTPEKTAFFKTALQEEGAKYNFKPEAFDRFYNWIRKDFSSLNTSYNNELNSNRILDQWKNEAEGLVMLISQIQLDDQHKEEVYSLLTDNNTVIFDRSYFTSKWVLAVNDDFYLILFISSFLIFITLLISYGRIELTLISFAPMFISWIIIVGVMGIIGMQFNIINIILSTFIFGIGDDFSIFIMDGLQNKYRTRKSLLNGHKTAIFFSAFTTIVGMGALAFAKHPALQSISVMSILGMIVVVLVSYTIPPLIFRIFIAGPATKGHPPYTFASLLVTVTVYSLFLIGCLFLRIVMLLLYLLPASKAKKRSVMCYFISLTCKFICKITFIIKEKRINITKEAFKSPSIIIANHQSFIDILFLLSLSPKLVMVTNEWVWKSPFFGAVIRYAGYFFTGNGYENALDSIEQRIKEGYSVVIFPEGTRSYDGKLKRFHKGAFYLAKQLNLDILPIILYGTGICISKIQPFYIKRGVVVIKALPKVSNKDLSFGETYKERTKKIASYFGQEYTALCNEYNDAIKNPYFYSMLVKNYIYKGPVEEWYVRIKVKMEKNYHLFDNLIPKKAKITDIGCGYGFLCNMLKMLSPDRQITGIDYDEDKIKVAENGFLNKNQIEYIAADAIQHNLPESDVFVLNDMLHYMDYDSQKILLTRCIKSLLPDGMIIVRDGNNEETDKQKVTALSEFFSTKILKFNKTEQELCFLSANQMQDIANEQNMTIENFKNDKYTSNTIFILRKRNE